MSKVLLAGESWSSVTVHTKGFDSFTTATYTEGAGPFCEAVRGAGHDVVFQPCHVAAESFPDTAEALASFDVVVLSDIGSNTLLLPKVTFVSAVPRPNRLVALRDWVGDGGALAMIGGYLSFQGIEGRANYRSSVLAEVLPVQLEIGDDRQETPQGAVPITARTPHQITAGLDSTWPSLLGFQRLEAKPDAEVLATIDDWPLLVTGSYGQGRVLAFASDIGPHWAPDEFCAWRGYGQMWASAMSWLGGER